MSDGPRSRLPGGDHPRRPAAHRPGPGPGPRRVRALRVPALRRCARASHRVVRHRRDPCRPRRDTGLHVSPARGGAARARDPACAGRRRARGAPALRDARAAPDRAPRSGGAAVAGAARAPGGGVARGGQPGRPWRTGGRSTRPDRRPRRSRTPGVARPDPVRPSRFDCAGPARRTRPPAWAGRAMRTPRCCTTRIPRCGPRRFSPGNGWSSTGSVPRPWRAACLRTASPSSRDTPTGASVPRTPASTGSACCPRRTSERCSGAPRSRSATTSWARTWLR